MQHVFIIGSKGMPARYGGYETFVDKLTEYHQNNKKIKYHIACKSNDNSEFIYHNARCFNIKVPNIGAIQAIYYDIIALKRCCKYIKTNNIKKPIIYILACRIGPFAHYFKNRIHKLGGTLYVNPDGHEFLRAKWPWLIKMYWKISEQLMVKHADLLICDSKCIERYIKEDYKIYNPNTKFIAYGSEISSNNKKEINDLYRNWIKDKGIKEDEYYLLVSRFVPENNYEIIIREFMKSKTKKSLVIICTQNKKFMKELIEKLHFDQDDRIKFVGTVYAQELLKEIRENAYAYIHGHEVGGTNPSLLEALGSTDLNLLLDVDFNVEVAENSTLYWNKSDDSLCNLINDIENMNKSVIKEFGKKAKERIRINYSWNDVAFKYEKVFLKK